MCLWPQKIKFWPSCKTVFVKIPKKILLRDEIDRKIRTLNSRFFSKILGITEKSSSLNSVENLLPEDDNFFAQCPKMSEKKKIFSQETVSIKLCLRIQREQFWQLRRQTFNDRQSFFSQCPENTKKRFNLKNASKSFYGHVASIFDEPV